MNKIIFFGSGHYTIPIVEKLKDNGLVLIVTTEPKGRLTDYLKKHSIPFFYSRLKTSEDIEKIKNLKPDLGILASFGAILPRQIIELFPLGIFNIHPSLLPQFKGPSPIQYQILAGIKESGVSIIKLDNLVDHGPIVAQKVTALTGNETLKSLSELLFSEGANLIQEIVQKLSNKLKVEEKPQSTKNESWTHKIEKKDGEIFPSKLVSRINLDGKIRAFYPWPGVYLTASLKGQEKLVKILPHHMVQVEGKKPMTHKDFINGYGIDAKTVLEKLGLLN